MKNNLLPELNSYNKLCFTFICLIGLLFAACAPAQKIHQRRPTTPPPQHHAALENLGKMVQAHGLEININPQGVIDLSSGFSLANSHLPQQAASILADTIGEIGGGIKLSNQRHRGVRQPGRHIAQAVISGAIKRFEKRFYDTGKGLPTNLSQITIELKLSTPTLPPLVSSQTITYSNTATTMSFSLQGDNYTLKGSTVRSKDENQTAIQILMEAGVIELLGRHLVLPYWDILPAGVAPVDPFVMAALGQRFTAMTRTGRIYQFQRLLFLHGFKPSLNGTLDPRTREALGRFDNKILSDSKPISLDVYKNLYLTLPVNGTTINRQKYLAQKGN